METATSNKPIPKFASFQPRAAQPPSENGDPAKTDGHDSSQALRSHGTWSSHQKRQRSVHREKKHEEQQEQIRLTSAIQDSEEHIFVIDRVGDEDILRYGSPDRWKIPMYRRSGYGNILGLHLREKIDRNSSGGKYVFTVPENTQKGRNKTIFAKMATLKELRIHEQAFARDDYNANYISLARTRGERRHHSYGDEGKISESSNTSEDDVDTHYRSINGQAKSGPADSDLEYSTAADQGDVGRNQEQDNLELLGKDLSRKVVEDPGDGEAWLNLIDFENRRARYQLSGHKHATADIKMSMYTKGLKQVKEERFRESLTLGMMREASMIWDPEKLSKKWEDILREKPNSVRLWIEYLNFLQTTFSNFRFEDLREPFARCVGALSHTIMSKTPDKNIYELYGYAILRMTSCMRDSGFSEQALAVWQALLEFNFCNPNFDVTTNHEMNSVVSSDKQSFEQFWDSEVARIGEEDARGWNNFRTGKNEPPSPRIDAATALTCTKPFSEIWYESEKNYANRVMLAARTVDDVGEDDPYRVILFSDIERFLINSPSGTPSPLVSSFLAFCQLPPLPHCTYSWWSDPFCRTDGLQNASNSLEDNHEHSLGKNDPFRLTTQHFTVCNDVLFADPKQWFSAFHLWHRENQLNGKSLMIEWARRTMRLLAERGVCGDDLAEYFLAFELSCHPEAVKKTAKALLKKNASSLRLYNAYALIESRLGNSTGADSVWTTALSMSRADPNVVLLWRTRTWEELESRGPVKALACLLSFYNQTTQSEPNALDNDRCNLAAILSAQRAILFKRDYFLSNKDYDRCTLCIECLMLLTYTSSSSPLEAVLSVLNSNQDLVPETLSSSSAFCERLHQSLAKLFYYHITHTSSFQPSLFRSCLSKSITSFPQNTIFLSLYAWNEARFRIDDRVRSIINDILSNPADGAGYGASRESVITHFFAIHSELSRAISLGSNIHSIRNTFERAVQSGSGSHSALLWKKYFLFESERGELQKAKDVFYRGVRACPWVKELYMLPFHYLRDIMSWQELRGCYELIVEKELRIHIPLEEAFEELEGAREGQSEDTSADNMAQSTPKTLLLICLGSDNTSFALCSDLQGALYKAFPSVKLCVDSATAITAIKTHTTANDSCALLVSPSVTSNIETFLLSALRPYVDCGSTVILYALASFALRPDSWHKIKNIFSYFSRPWEIGDHVTKKWTLNPHMQIRSSRSIVTGSEGWALTLKHVHPLHLTYIDLEKNDNPMFVPMPIDNEGPVAMSQYGTKGGVLGWMGFFDEDQPAIDILLGALSIPNLLDGKAKSDMPFIPVAPEGYTMSGRPENDDDLREGPDDLGRYFHEALWGMTRRRWL